MRRVAPNILGIVGFLTIFGLAYAEEPDVPEPFRGYDDASTMSINYDDLTALLRVVVVDIGRSNRKVAQPAEDVTGTRMKAKVSMTSNEGNRFYFETFDGEEEGKEFLRNIQSSLEQLPSEVPLNLLSRDEQLAYWLNLYNVTVLNQLIELYPKRDLKKQFRGKSSIFSKEILTVDGVSLSLNDIQFAILKPNYDSDPLILYGLYQGIIGGPNIRKTAFTGTNVYASLKDNAVEFINSNRGTYSKYGDRVRVSSLYSRNSAYFPNFESDLTIHLLEYIEGSERTKLQAATSIKPDINDWNITDLGGSHRRIGGSLADSRAALLDSARSTVPDPNNPGKLLGASIGAGSSSMAATGKRISGIQPEVLIMLKELDEKRMAEHERNASVGIEDIEEELDEADTQ